MHSHYRRRNVYRDNRRADSAIAVVCIIAAIVLAALCASNEQAANDARDDIQLQYPFVQ